MAAYDSGWAPHVEPAGSQEVVDGDVVREIDAPVVVDGEEAPAEPAAAKPSRRRPRAAKGRSAGEGRTARKAADAPAKPRKSAAKPRAGRSRARTDSTE